MSEQGLIIEEVAQKIDLTPVVDYLTGTVFGFAGVLFAWGADTTDTRLKYPMYFSLGATALLWKAPIQTPAFLSGYMVFPLVSGLGVFWWNATWGAGWNKSRNATLGWLAKSTLPIAPLLIARASRK
jgi:hypothetical protein